MVEAVGFDIPLWIFPAIGFVLAAGLFNTVQKWVVSNTDPIDVAYHTNLIAGVILSPGLLLLLGSGEYTRMSLALVFLSGFVNAVSFYLFATSLKLEDLGVIAPTRGVIPIATAFVEPFVFATLDFNQDFLIAGVLASTGLYIVATRDSIFKPVKHLSSRGFLLGVASSLAIVLAVFIDRTALATGTTPLLYSISIAFTTVLSLSLIRVITHGELPSLTPDSPKLFIAGGTRAMTLGLGVFTLSLATGTQFNIIAQLAIPLSVIIGWAVFDERGEFGRRMIGTSLIILGVVLVV